MKKLRDLDLTNKDVLLRVDFNVPLNPEGQIIDETRLKATWPTIKHLLDHNCRIVVISHLGRPKGPDSFLSLQKVIPYLQKLFHQSVLFANSISEAKKLLSTAKPKTIILLENLRFHAEEEDPQLNPFFAKELATLGQVYINDAFACAHRPHSSITEVTKYFPVNKAAGFLLEHESNELKKVLKPHHPFFLLLGGSKISTKIGVINSLLPKADSLFIGGAMAFPFVSALNVSTGLVTCDAQQIQEARKIIEAVNDMGKNIYLPIDWKCKENIKNNQSYKIFTMKSGIPSGFQAFDIGPETVIEWSKLLKPAKTIFWNGPLGMYEVPPFDQGTAQIAKSISNLACESIVGGGDSVAAIEKQRLSDKFTHLSTGGGASLEFLEKGNLPGIEALN